MMSSDEAGNLARRTPALAALMTLATALIACSMTRREAAAGAASPCAASVAMVLTSPDGYSAFVETPQIVRGAEDIFIVGFPSFAFRPDGYFYRAGDKTTAPAMLVGARVTDADRVSFLPSPVSQFLANPKPVVDPERRVHLFWVDGDTLFDPILGRPITTARWTGNRWSDPVQVISTGRTSVWRRNTISPTTTIEGVPQFVVTPGLSGDGAATRISWENGRWAAAPLPDHYEIYTSIAAIGDTALFAYVDFGAPDGNAVFVKRSTDRGRTFLPPVRLSAPGSGPAYDPRIHPLPRGNFAVVWLTGGDSFRSTLFAARSDDRGRTWQTSVPFPVATGIGSMRSAVTNTGKVAVVVQIGDNRRLVPTYIEWQKGTWSSPLPLITDSSSSLGVPAIEGGDNVILAWGEYAPGARRPITKYMRLPADCQSPGG